MRSSAFFGRGNAPVVKTGCSCKNVHDYPPPTTKFLTYLNSYHIYWFLYMYTCTGFSLCGFYSTLEIIALGYEFMRLFAVFSILLTPNYCLFYLY